MGARGAAITAASCWQFDRAARGTNQLARGMHTQAARSWGGTRAARCHACLPFDAKQWDSPGAPATGAPAESPWGACEPRAQGRNRRRAPSRGLPWQRAPAQTPPRVRRRSRPQCRLYFDAEVEEGVAEPLSSSLCVVDLPGAPLTSSRGAAGGAAEAAATAWAGTQWAWFPDAAYVSCGRPGHYQVSPPGAASGLRCPRTRDRTRLGPRAWHHGARRLRGGRRPIHAAANRALTPMPARRGVVPAGAKTSDATAPRLLAAPTPTPPSHHLPPAPATAPSFSSGLPHLGPGQDQRGAGRAAGRRRGVRWRRARAGLCVRQPPRGRGSPGQAARAQRGASA